MKKLLILLISLCATNVPAQTKTVEAYSTYLTAPFFVDVDNGLANDLVSYLNTVFKDKYTFKLTLLPRLKLNLEILKNADFDGVVLFQNPLFVDDKEMKKYAWSAPIMRDQNDVVSSLKSKIEYTGPSALSGKTFIGVRGYRYAGLEERFGKDIKRVDAKSEMQALIQIASGRAEVTLLSHFAYAYLTTKDKDKALVADQLYVSATPYLKFDRFMFSSLKNKELANSLAAASKTMQTDPKWLAILRKYDESYTGKG